MRETCNYCGKVLTAAESMINDKYYCHTFSDEYPTCYMKASWNGTKPINQEHMAL